ncbi:MAG: protease inhibitor I42 family protein [Solirubrobacterales bacterium]
MSGVELDEGDAGGEIELIVGEEAEIVLVENATTGFRWSWDEAPGLETVAEREPPGGSTYGAAGRLRLRVVPRAAGRHELNLRLMREWNEEVARELRFTLLARPANDST